MPHSLVLAKELYTFEIGYYNKLEECLKIVKTKPTPTIYILRDSIRTNNRKILPHLLP